MNIMNVNMHWGRRSTLRKFSKICGIKKRKRKEKKNKNKTIAKPCLDLFR